MKRKYTREEVLARMIGNNLYFNPNDTNIFVRKRYGIGAFTMNMGNPWSWVIAGGIVLLAVVLIR